jgi:hypothetical protein
VHKFLTQNQWKPLNLSQKDKHNTKQIKYRQQLTLSPIGVADSGYFPLNHSSTNTADADTPSLSLHDVHGLRVRNSRHSTSSEAFVNLGLTVLDCLTEVGTQACQLMELACFSCQGFPSISVTLLPLSGHP